jgi:hypothetical protein
MTFMNSRLQIINAWAQNMALNHSSLNKIVILTSLPYNVTVIVMGINVYLAKISKHALKLGAFEAQPLPPCTFLFGFEEDFI